MKKYISTLIAIVAVSSLWQTNAPGAVEMDDSELATLYGGVIWGIDCDCIVGAGACPSEVGAILGCAGCGSSAEDCTGACSTTSNYICGNPKMANNRLAMYSKNRRLHQQPQHLHRMVHNGRMPLAGWNSACCAGL